MKKVLLIGLLSLLSFSCMRPTCSTLMPKDYDYNWNSPLIFESLKEIITWQNKNLERTGKYGDATDWQDYWQTPAETYKRKGGDCEDWQLFFMYHAKKLGYEPKFLIIYVKTKKDKEAIMHIVVRIGNQIYDPIGWHKSSPFNGLKNYPDYVKTVREYTYQEAMYCADKWHADWWVGFGE